jgi:hypothetical protein
MNSIVLAFITTRYPYSHHVFHLLLWKEQEIEYMGLHFLKQDIHIAIMFFIYCKRNRKLNIIAFFSFFFETRYPLTIMFFIYIRENKKFTIWTFFLLKRYIHIAPMFFISYFIAFKSSTLFTILSSAIQNGSSECMFHVNAPSSLLICIEAKKIVDY